VVADEIEPLAPNTEWTAAASRADTSRANAAEFAFRDPRSLAADLARLAEHFDAEAVRLRREAREAVEAAQECREWANDVRQQPQM